MSSSEKEDALTSLSFTSILGLSLGAIFVIVILIFVAINGLQQTSNSIISTAQQGLTFVSTSAAAIVDQGKNAVSSLSGSINVAAENTYDTIYNAVNQVANVLSSLGTALYNNIVQGFSTISSFLAELGNQLLITFFSYVASNFIQLLSGIQLVKFNVDISYAIFQAFLNPILIIISFINGTLC